MNRWGLGIALLGIVNVYAHKIPFVIKDTCTDVTDVAYIFAHGLASTHKQGLSMFTHLATLEEKMAYNSYWMLKNPLILFDFPDAKNDGKIQWHAKQVTLGQEDDITALSNAYEYACTHFPSYTFVIGGVSRGAATALNFVATKKPEKVAALVLECPFDSFESIVNHLLKQFYIGWLPFSDKLGLKYMERLFPRLKLTGIVPLQVVHTIDPALPILFLHSKIDRTVPVNSSRALYVRLHETGHKKVHLFELEVGQHARLLKGSEGQLCHSIVQAFYAHYSLPHEPQAAREGSYYFATYCQPSVADIKRKMRKNRSLESGQECMC